MFTGTVIYLHGCTCVQLKRGGEFIRVFSSILFSRTSFFSQQKVSYLAAVVVVWFSFSLIKDKTKRNADALFQLLGSVSLIEPGFHLESTTTPFSVCDLTDFPLPAARLKSYLQRNKTVKLCGQKIYWSGNLSDRRAPGRTQFCFCLVFFNRSSLSCPLEWLTVKMDGVAVELVCKHFQTLLSLAGF